MAEGREGTPTKETETKDKFDYVAYSRTGNVYDFKRLEGVNPTSGKLEPISLVELPENTILEVETEIGTPYYIRPSGALESRIVKEQFKKSRFQDKLENEPLFVKQINVDKKQTLEDSGYEVKRAQSLLLDERMNLPTAA